MKKKNNKFLIVGLVDNFIDQLAVDLAYDNNLYYLNVESLINYSILEKQKMIETCGIEYFKKQEEKIIFGLKEYENVLAFVKFSTFVEYSQELKSMFKVVYFKIDKNEIKKNKTNVFATENLTDVVFDERDEFLKNHCDKLIKCDINNKEQAFKAFKTL